MMSMMMLVMLVMLVRMRMVMYVKCTKEAGSEINERDANNYKVEPAPDNWDLSDIAKYSTEVRDVSTRHCRSRQRPPSPAA